MAAFETFETRERTGRSLPGIPMLVGGVVGAMTGFALIAVGIADLAVAPAVAGVVLNVVGAFVFVGLYTIEPNNGAVLTLFGDYRGTARTPGMRWSNPFYTKEKISLRVRNFVTTTSKVNDANGNPILIAAVVVWQVVDTARAVFNVDDYEGYVTVQAESAVRHLARSYPYESFDVGEEAGATLVGDVDEVNASLSAELGERLVDAGVKVVEARLTDLSYAPEIAEAMLRRQQASAVVAARKKIVEAAVAMVRDAVALLERPDGGEEPISLDPDRRATFASNLMTVIVSEQPATPIVNVGTLTR